MSALASEGKLEAENCDICTLKVGRKREIPEKMHLQGEPKIGSPLAKAEKECFSPSEHMCGLPAAPVGSRYTGAGGPVTETGRRFLLRNAASSCYTPLLRIIGSCYFQSSKKILLSIAKPLLAEEGPVANQRRPMARKHCWPTVRKDFRGCTSLEQQHPPLCHYASSVVHHSFTP